MKLSTHQQQPNKPSQVQRPVDESTVTVLAAVSMLKDDVEAHVSCKTLPVPKRVQDILVQNIQDSLSVLAKEYGGER